MSSAPSSQAKQPLSSPTADVSPRSQLVAVLIPAYAEATTVAEVVAVALEAAIGEVLVVDDGSPDGTAAVAEAAGASVVRLTTNRGKGGALEAGARRLRAEVVVLLDADLVGLTPAHVHALAGPVVDGDADMTRGVFSGGRLRTTLAQRIAPQLNGQRALRRLDLLAVPELGDSRYGVEVAITRHAIASGWRFLDVPLLGVSQVMKEEKRGLWAGLMVRAKMYLEILRTLLSGHRG